LTPEDEEWTKLTSLPKYEADLLAGRLKEEGIPAQTSKATNDPAGWLKAYGAFSGPVDVYVAAAKTGAARKLLARLNPPEPEERPRRRPIEIIGRILILAVIAALLGALVFGVVEKVIGLG
jgi:hypothetical protein